MEFVIAGIMEISVLAYVVILVPIYADLICGHVELFHQFCHFSFLFLQSDYSGQAGIRIYLQWVSFVERDISILQPKGTELG